MNSAALEMERSIARCRVVLSLLAILAIMLDPTEPALTRWLPLTGGFFVVNRYWVTVLLAHLTCGVALVSLQSRNTIPPARLAVISAWVDVLFGAAVALVTEGETSLFQVFFAFTVVSVGLRSGLRPALAVTAVSIAFYTVVTVVSAPDNQRFYVMRAVYLGITGYLVGYLGQLRLVQEARIRTLEASAQRERIARSLHDGYAQALAGVNLQIQSCRELFRRGRHDDALAGLADLQTGVNHEHDQLRSYIRSLVERDATPVPDAQSGDARFSVHADFQGSAPFVEHVLHIMLEGTRNVRRHARARAAAITAATTGGALVLAIDDDGVGFADGTELPWSIASRVAEFGGALTLQRDGQPGGHLRIELPAA